MKIYKGIALFAIAASTFACKSNDIKESREDFYAPQIEGQESSLNQKSNFDSLPSSESLSKTSFLPDRISFAFDSSNLSSSQKQILDSQIAFIKENESEIAKIRISGYCDQRGRIEYNYALGERRANVIKKYFLKNGISSSKLETISYGKEVVLVVGNSEQTYAQNRVGKISLCESRSC